MARGSTGNRLAYGLTVMIFGVLFLLLKTGLLVKIPFAENLVSTGSFLLIAGIVFLTTKAEQTTGIILTISGAILCSDIVFNWMQNFTGLITSLTLIITGLILVLTAKK